MACGLLVYKSLVYKSLVYRDCSSTCVLPDIVVVFLILVLAIEHVQKYTLILILTDNVFVEEKVGNKFMCTNPIHYIIIIRCTMW